MRGVALASALSRIPLERLITKPPQLGPLPLMQAMLGYRDFGYAVIASPDGTSLEVVSQIEMVPPIAAASSDPATWTEQHVVDAHIGRDAIREFTAPVLAGGELVARIRIGLREPSYVGVLTATSFHATIALLVFLMLPAAYVWLRSELRPLSDVARELDSDAEQAASDLEMGGPPTRAIAAISERFRAYSRRTAEQSERLSRERMSLLAASKVATHERNRVTQLVEAIPDAVLALGSDGRITVANQRAATLLRTPSEELLGAAPGSWSPSEELVRLIGRHSGSGAPLRRPEVVPAFGLDGEGSRRFEASLHPLPATDGIAVLLRDVTAEHAARQTQAEFLGHMAHELKAPLNVIAMYGETLQGAEGEDAAFRVEACNVIRDEVDRLNGLINNIFSIGRIESGIVSIDRQRVRTAEFLEDVFKSVSRGGHERELVFELKLGEPLTPIWADKPLLGIAIGNLLTNAVKYNRDGGSVLLSAEEDEQGLLIGVKDTGHGIREEEIERVFEKFYRAEDDATHKVAGHGLGLALVKEIVALHGGEIRVESVVGEGSTFSLFFGRNCAVFQEVA